VLRYVSAPRANWRFQRLLGTESAISCSPPETPQRRFLPGIGECRFMSRSSLRLFHRAIGTVAGKLAPAVGPLLIAELGKFKEQIHPRSMLECANTSATVQRRRAPPLKPFPRNLMVSSSKLKQRSMLG
jgi:hypothetical protein